MHEGSWICVPTCPEDAACSTQSRAHFKRVVFASVQSGGRCLVHGKIGSDLCLLLPLTVVHRRGHTAQGNSSLQRWWLLLFGSIAVGRDSFQLFPDTQLFAVQKSVLLSAACLGDLQLNLSLETVVRCCTIFHVLCLAEGPNRQVMGSPSLPSSTEGFLYPQQSLFLHFAVYLKRLCGILRRKVNRKLGKLELL